MWELDEIASSCFVIDSRSALCDSMAEFGLGDGDAEGDRDEILCISASSLDMLCATSLNAISHFSVNCLRSDSMQLRVFCCESEDESVRSVFSSGMCLLSDLIFEAMAEASN